MLFLFCASSVFVLSSFLQTAVSENLRTESTHNSLDIFEGEYHLQSSKNFDSFLSALGVGFILRKLAQTVNPTFYVKKEGKNEYRFISDSPFRKAEFKFKLGEPFIENRLDGVKCESIITRDGNKLIQIEKSNPLAEIIREFKGDDLIITCKTTDSNGQIVEAVRFYKRAKPRIEI